MVAPPARDLALRKIRRRRAAILVASGLLCIVASRLLFRDILAEVDLTPSGAGWMPSHINDPGGDIAVSTCFTPAQSCVGHVVDALNRARFEIRMQAYGFTSQPIISALVAARQRGVDVAVILDKSDEHSISAGSASYVLRSGIPVFVDYQPKIAHNKILIIDRAVVLTGSYNFTASAEHGNAENITFLSSPDVAKKFLKNWDSRRALSRSFFWELN